MTGTSKAYKRLGVAGLGAVLVTVGAWVPATMANASTGQATTATSTAIDPASDAAAVGDCNPYTVTVPEGASFTVKITQQVSRATDGTTTGIGFCTPATTNDSTAMNAGAVYQTPGNTTTSVNGVNIQCYNATAPAAGQTNTLSCQADYQDSVDADHTVIIGVTSSETGTMNIQTWGDLNANGAVDVNEQGSVANATKTWVARTVTSIDCTPKSATNPTNTIHQFSCTTKGAQDVTISGADVRFYVQSGPDSAAYPASPGTQCGTFNAGNNTAVPNTTGSDSTGTATCRLQNVGVPGTDQIYVWVESNSIAGPQPDELNQTISKTWVNAAPAGSQVSVSCSPNPTSTTGTAPNTSSVCQDPTTDKDVTFTATVMNGVPSTAQSGVLVQWKIANNNGGNATAANGTLEPTTPSNEAETLSATSCTTDASGQCSVTLNDPTPTEGEAIQVQANVVTQANVTSSATGTKIWHNPAPDEARNIAVDPSSQTATSGGAATLTATVTDRFVNPVANVFVNWTESGPGAFRSGSQCKTDATGKCTIEVTSLSTETGAETVTATIAGATANSTTTSTSECAAPADKSNYGPTAYNVSAAQVTTDAQTADGAPASNTATGAPAGACSDQGTVTWKPQVTPPPAKTKITALINCFSPKKHVLKCKVKEAPAKAGLTVVFKRKTASGVHKIGVAITNSNGVAKITKRHLKRHKVWRVFAHVRSTSTTTGATTGTDRTRIK